VLPWLATPPVGVEALKALVAATANDREQMLSS
jgi:hypothetical protein